MSAVQNLSGAVGSPTFPPHLTVLTGIEGEVRNKGISGDLGAERRASAFTPTFFRKIFGQEDEVVARVREVASRLASFEIPFVGAEAGASYFQCVYLLCDRTPSVLAANAAFKAGLGPLVKWAPNPEYKPHVSLLYGDLTPAAKEASLERLRRDHGALLQPGAAFVASELTVWQTGAGLSDLDMTSWREAAAFKLS